MSEILDVLRTERKYPITAYEAERLRLHLEPIIHADEHSVNGKGYCVRSLYFDSFDNSDFFEKEAGIEYRKKIRLRIYGSSDAVIKLETKQKQGSLQRKLSIPVSRPEADALIRGDYDFLLSRGEPLAHEFYALMRAQTYLPRCVVQYDRYAFTAPVNDIRITFDSNLCGSESDFDIFKPDLPLFPVPPLNTTTLEVKYSGFLLSYIKDALDIGQLTENASSKYCAVRTYSLGGHTI